MLQTDGRKGEGKEEKMKKALVMEKLPTSKYLVRTSPVTFSTSNHYLHACYKVCILHLSVRSFKTINTIMSRGGTFKEDEKAVEGKNSSSFVLHESHNNGGEGNNAEDPHEEPFLISLAGVVGNMMEWYDFSCFGFFSDIIGDQFFAPVPEGNSSLVKSFAVFGAAFLVRPIGGALIGQHGDSVGRKSALEASLFLMAIPTFALGCLPTYAMISWGATILLVLCRLLQGMSVGGQMMSSLVFTVERKPKSRWGLWGAGVFSACAAGVTVGSLMNFIVRNVTTDEQLNAWGWRIPFLLGALGAGPAAYLKKYGKEHPIEQQDCQEEALQEGSKPGSPRRQKSVIAETFSRANRRSLIASALVPALPSATYYIFSIWLGIFMEDLVDPPVPYAFAINSVSNIIGIFMTLIGGAIADCYGGYSHIMVFSGISMAILSPILLNLIGHGNPFVAFCSQLTLGFFCSLWTGSMLPWLVLSFPPKVRLTSVSIGYSTAAVVFGGFTPAVATLLVTNFSNYSAGLYLTTLAILSIVGIFVAPGSTRLLENGDSAERTPLFFKGK